MGRVKKAKIAAPPEPRAIKVILAECNLDTITNCREAVEFLSDEERKLLILEYTINLKSIGEKLKVVLSYFFLKCERYLTYNPKEKAYYEDFG